MFLNVFLFCLQVYSETLKEYNMRKIFLEKSFTKCAGEIFPRLFPKKPKLSISLDQ